MNSSKISRYCGAALLGALLCSNSFAQPVQNNAVYLQYGLADHSADSWALGVHIPWNHWNYPLGSGLVTGYWDIWGGQWRGDYQGSNRSTWVIGAKPTLRWRPDQGRSPWFMEAGIGVSYAVNHLYLTDHKDFSTRYNFASHLGIGYLFGEQRKNEVSLRLEHHSNAGIKSPNPGENFLQIRYARHF